MRGGGDSLGGPNIDQGVLVAARLVVIQAEGKPAKRITRRGPWSDRRAWPNRRTCGCVVSSRFK